MRKEFNQVFRVSFEEESKTNPNMMGNELLSIINGIEAKARAVREAGKDPYIELKQEIEELTTRMILTNAREANIYHMEIADIKRDYMDEMNKNPAKELMDIKRAEMRINAMSEDEKGKAIVSGDMTHHEAQILKAGMNPERRSTIDETIATEMIDQPWLSTPALRELHSKAIEFGNLKDMVVIEGSRVPVERLIDLNGELDQPHD